MKIGGIDLGRGALLAPMEAVTDLPFRTLCEEHGAALTYTELLSAEAITRGASRVAGRMWASLGGRPFAVQVFGREPEVMAEAARRAADSGACLVDINMGCPARKVTAGLCGAALMREPDLATRIVAAVRAALPTALPVTVKQRAGWDDQCLNAADFARQLVTAGAAAITVHGRTRAQGFSGTVRLASIAEVRAALPHGIPVVGNGGVKSVADHLAMKQQTGCDAVMIGRASRGNPWLFREVLAAEEGRPAPARPTVAERRAVWRRHAELIVAYASPKMVLHELRKTLAWYSRGLWGGAELRRRCFAESDAGAVRGLGEAYFARLGERESRSGDVAAPAVPIEEKCRERHARRTGVPPEGLEACEA
jgi:tRNA-dihydrouridine synthase B